MAEEQEVSFKDLRRNDPNLGQKSVIFLRPLQQGADGDVDVDVDDVDIIKDTVESTI